MGDLFGSAATWWFILGVLMFIAEVMGSAGFLIGAGVAAFAMAVVTWFLPGLGLVAQFVYYAITAVLATFVYFKFFRATQPSNKAELPSREQQMVGRQFELAESMADGIETRVQIGDTLWRAVSDTDIEAGATVEVESVDAMRLMIRPVS